MTLTFEGVPTAPPELQAAARRFEAVWPQWYVRYSLERAPFRRGKRAWPSGSRYDLGLCSARRIVASPSESRVHGDADFPQHRDEHISEIIEGGRIGGVGRAPAERDFHRRASEERGRKHALQHHRDACGGLEFHRDICGAYCSRKEGDLF